MFTGIVQAKCKVERISRKPGLITTTVCLPPVLRQEVNLGASIANDGVCLTVTSFDEKTGLVRSLPRNQKDVL